jgi:hypothetical protein
MKPITIAIVCFNTKYADEKLKLFYSAFGGLATIYKQERKVVLLGGLITFLIKVSSDELCGISHEVIIVDEYGKEVG